MTSINFKTFLLKIGVCRGCHVMVHSSLKQMRQAFGAIDAGEMIKILKNVVTEEGSLIMPTFTYCFKKRKGEQEAFDRETSGSKTGLLTEVFRTSEGVVRTASPTHSFALWGNVTSFFDAHHAPASPLGKASVLNWLAEQDKAFILLLGTDFTSLTFGHYLENITPMPWVDHCPWDYLDVLPVGVSTRGQQSLKEVPGCSKSFTNFQHDLHEQQKIKPFYVNGVQNYNIPVSMLVREGLPYFRNNPMNLLCKQGTCQACDARRFFYMEKVKRQIEQQND
ncbi:MAG: hypothetical protein GF313_14300 [Caldithrix sp.]|nr:hypothetical protein [Caldithrix sp.]